MGNEARHILKRLLDALFLTLWNFATFKCCLEHSNGRCSWDVYSHIPFIGIVFIRGKSSVMMARLMYYIRIRGIVHSYQRGLQRCSFDNIGQCEGLRAWNG